MLLGPIQYHCNSCSSPKITLSQVCSITMSDLHSCSSWKQQRWKNIMTCVRIHQVSTSAIYLCTMCAAGRPGASDYPLPDKSDIAIKKLWANCPSGDRYKCNNIPLNPDPSDESHWNFHFLFETAVYLSHSISISTMTRYPNKRCLDSSLHWSLIVFYLFQPNHQPKKHQPGLNLQCPIPLSVLPAPSLLSQGLNITETPLWSEDNDVIKKDSYQPVLITTIL